MKVCIVTLYNSENCGAFLQAHALGAKIEQLGHEAVYLKRSVSGTGASHWAALKTIAKSLLRLDFKYAGMKLKFHFQCRKDSGRFATIDDPARADMFVLGSDVIWQLRSKQFATHMTRFWGLDFPVGKSIAYAPSTNGTPAEMFANDERVALALCNMKAISVRDEYSRQVLSYVTDRPIELVCDPTMLHGPDYYRGIQRACPHERFILIYAFHRDFCSKDQVRQLQAFARERGLKIISFGLNRPWCDLSVPYDVLGMTAYFDKADFIITNTFHGSVFSLIFHKRFANFAYDKSKVNELLAHFDMMDRTLRPDMQVQDVLDRPMDEAALEAKIEALRQSSIAYLQANLKED